MGLDMELTRKHYVGGKFDHLKVTGIIKIKTKHKELNLDPKNVASITEDVFTWRKANHIHKWFVDNVQDGDDNCAEYYADYDKLLELRDSCEKAMSILNDESLSEEEKSDFLDDVLPTIRGFFFGGADYDDWYKETTQDTLEMLNGLDSSGSYYYSSSW